MVNALNINHIQVPAVSVSPCGKILKMNDPLESILPSSSKIFKHISEILIDIKPSNKRALLDESRLIGNEKVSFIIFTLNLTDKENLIIILPSHVSKNLHIKANYDSLTNLANRSLFRNRLEIALELAK